MLTVDKPADMKAHIGEEMGASDWLLVDQPMIDKFAEATGDHQWIHLDAERSKRESPYGTTVAHGFLTLSLLSQFAQQAMKFSKARMGVNYGFNRVRFTGPVKVGSKLRAKFSLHEFEEIKGGAQTTWNVSMECEGEAKPCCVAEWVTRRYD